MNSWMIYSMFFIIVINDIFTNKIMKSHMK
jgi:hypothetical protein